MKHYLSVSLEPIQEHDNWRELALQWARRKSCSHAFITSADHFLMENSIRKLISLDKVVISPLLNAPFGNYSNVHGVLGDDFVYREEIESIRASAQASYISKLLGLFPIWSVSDQLEAKGFFLFDV